MGWRKSPIGTRETWGGKARISRPRWRVGVSTGVHQGIGSNTPWMESSGYTRVAPEGRFPDRLRELQFALAAFHGLSRQRVEPALPLQEYLVVAGCGRSDN